MTSEKIYDVVIIGGGPGGYTAAIRISQLGGTACIVEKNQLGGVCANTGCIPTKTLVSSARLFSQLQETENYGFKVGKTVLDFRKITGRAKSAAERSVQGIKELLKSSQVEVISGTASLLSSKEVEVLAEGSPPRILKARNIILATGSSPIMPSFLPCDKRIFTTENLLQAEELPRELLILGGGYIGLEYACIFHSVGVKVSLVETLPRLLPNEDSEISAEMEKILRRRGVEIHTNTRITHVVPGERISVNAENRIFQADALLLALGRKPNFNPEEMQKVGIKFNEAGINTDSRLRTSLPGVYAVGDVNGKFPLAHTAIREGIVAAENIMGQETVMDYENIPRCLFTYPEVASIGKITCQLGKFPFLANGKAHASGETEGFVKVYFENNLLVGASIFGAHASDLVAFAGSLLGKPREEIKKMIIAHPTLPEAVYEAVLDVEKEAIHLPKKKI